MFHAIQNLRAQTTFEIPAPWEVWQDYPNPPEARTKEAIEKWRMAPGTKHAFISGFSGLDARVRISQGNRKEEMQNPPRYMHAFIADYDAACTDVHVANITAKPPSDYFPTYIFDSFRPGHKRLVWLFEQPLILGGTYSSAMAFTRKLAQEIKASLWLPGFDDACLHPRMYFAIGGNWRALDALPLPHHILCNWAMVSDAQVHFTDNALSPPPIEKIAELVTERFPGRWQGEFEIGRRGCVFFEPSAGNHTAAVVMSEGLRTFSTGTKGFYTWEEIFGQRAIDELRGEQQGSLRDRVLFDGRRYWIDMGEGRGWEGFEKTDFQQFLVCTMKMDDRRPKGGGPSRVEQFMNEVRLTFRVEDALPFVFKPAGRVQYQGSWYLNTARVAVSPPGTPLFPPDAGFHEAGPAGFPFLHRFLSHLFAPLRYTLPYAPSTLADKDAQLMHFLAWHHRFYKGGYTQKPLPGQAVIVAGKTGRGKTLLAHGIVGASVGGAADGSDFLVGSEQWTSEVLRKALITVDDDTVGDDVAKHRAFTTKLKKLVANAQAVYNKKHGSAGRVEWMGRVFITCNLDPESMRLLPDLSQSNEDKLMMFLAGDGIDLPDKNTLGDILAKEMPQYLRWLLEWRVPAWLLAGDERFWVRPFHHPHLSEAAASNGVVSNVLEMLREIYDLFCEASEDTLVKDFRVNPNLKDKVFLWQGPTRSLLRIMRQLDVAQYERFTYQQIGTMLGILSSRGFKITRLPGQDWRIVFDQALLSGVTDTSGIDQTEGVQSHEQ